MCILCEDTNDKIREYGKIFGYPDCCIEEFITDKEHFDKTGIDNRNHEQIAIANLTAGFVPCKKHAEEISNGLPVDKVIINRNVKESKRLNLLSD